LEQQTVHWCPYTGTRTLVTLHCFPYTGTLTLVPIHWLPYTGSHILVPILVPLHWYRYTGTQERGCLQDLQWLPTMSTLYNDGKQTSLHLVSESTWYVEVCGKVWKIYRCYSLFLYLIYFIHRGSKALIHEISKLSHP
jgi:hypothetical protein